MTRFSQRFSQQATLRAVRPDQLLSLLNPHRAYFERRGVQLPAVPLCQSAPAGGGHGFMPIAPPGAIDYDGIARVLMTPDVTTPLGLVDDLFFIDEMATSESMDALCEAIAELPASLQDKLALGAHPTPADVAVAARLYAPALLEQVHAEAQLSAKRSFRYFHPAKSVGFAPTALCPRTLEGILDEAFDAIKRGRGTRVTASMDGEQLWLLVQRGDLCKREPAHGMPSNSCIYYRPEIFDVIRLDTRTGELSISAGNCKRIYELYRQALGTCFFGDAAAFLPYTAAFTLDPLRAHGEAALVCSDVSAIEWVRLVGLRFLRVGPESEIEDYRASDVFLAMRRRRRKIPDDARILKAHFLIKFVACAVARAVTVTSSNITAFTRDADALAVEEWLSRRGFITGVAAGMGGPHP